MVRDEEMLLYATGEGGDGRGSTGKAAPAGAPPVFDDRPGREGGGGGGRGGGGGIGGVASVGADAVGRARGAAAVAGTALLHAELEVRQLGARLTRVLLASPAGREQAVGSAKLTRAMTEAAATATAEVAEAKAYVAAAAGGGGGGGGGVGGVPTVSSTISMALGLEDLPRQLNMMSREMDIYRRRLDAASRSNT